MAKTLQTPDRLFDRTWRPGHPFRPRISGLRRWGMGSLFTILCIVIGGYLYITDSRRVSQMAEDYLSSLLGGEVKVGVANLSIFEGLRLEDVKLYADGASNPDSLLFSAKSFQITYDLRALLTGKIEATKILAIDPVVRVTEDANTGRRNYSHLVETRVPSSMPTAQASKLLTLPAIVLRNAQLKYSRLLNGQVMENSSIDVEGSVEQAGDAYSFKFQSRGHGMGIGPTVNGQVEMATGRVTASLQNFDFGTDVKSMLPPDVRRWWDQHELTGRVSVPVLSYVPPAFPGASPGYRVELALDGVTLAVRPEEWMGDDEHRKLEDLHDAFSAMRIVGLNDFGFVDHLAELVEPSPLNLKQVRGRFVFAEDQSIEIDDLNGRMEEIPFKISGTIKGYTPAAEAHLRIASSDLDDIVIPAAPRYINSLPPAVREIYDRFKPRGTCRFWVDLDRPEPGARPRVTGQIDIVDGNFTFDRFPYPLRKTTGQIVLNYDPSTGEESLRMEHIRGRGIEGGPNENRFVDINGEIGPFGPDAAVDVIVAAQQATAEPALVAAFPTMTRKALTMFDAPGKGEYPKFSGDFVCHVVRVRGLDSDWVIDTSIHLDDATGELVSFPYLMTGVSGDLKIHGDGLELTKLTMKKGDATMQIDGRISWPHVDDDVPVSQLPPISLRPNLKIEATDIPIDSDLLNALPAAQRVWLQKMGIGGVIDLQGNIRPPTSTADDLDLDFHIALRNGTVFPVGNGSFAASNVEGNLRLTNQRLVVNNLTGKRGDADLSAHGEVSWPGDAPRIVVRAEAHDLAMDDSLYKLLPESSKAAWDEVRPEGTLDATLSYSGATSHSATQPNATTQPVVADTMAGAYELLLTPRRLSATPRSAPYRLEQLGGSVTILPDKVLLKDMTARHGDTKVRLSGTGLIGAQQIWDFNLAADDVPLDDDIRHAIPPALADLFQSTQLHGKVNFEFSKLRFSPPAGAKPGTVDPTSAMSDVDFAVKLSTKSGSVDVGVPLSDVRGTMEAVGSSRAGKLWSLNGRIDCDSLTLSGRPLTRLHAELLKPPGQPQLTIDRIEAALAHGGLAGTVDYAYSDTGPSRYAANLTLRNADVKELTGESEPQDIQGQLSASLALEGTSDQPLSRRGRGVVEINGEHMYRIPLILGLLQITNLSLPITSPFTQASARYIIDANKVTFESIELHSKEMMMQGTGNLDFNTKQVSLTFVTDSTAWPKLPFIGALLEGARHDLLQIQVRGTLQEPKVSARAMNTLTTTVDKVFRGDEAPAAVQKLNK